MTYLAVNIDPHPNVIAGQRGHERILVDLSAVSSHAIDTPRYPGGGPDNWTLRIPDLRGAMQRGFERLLGNFGTVTTAPPAPVTARFSVVDFRLVEQARGCAVLLGWQFVLSDASGTPIVRLAESTVGPEGVPLGLGTSNDATEQVTNLLDIILERIGNALDAAHWPPTSA